MVVREAWYVARQDLELSPTEDRDDGSEGKQRAIRRGE